MPNLPPAPQPDLCLFHWSPTTNRKSITKYGLRTHQRTIQRLAHPTGEAFRPPVICLSEDPQLAWILSGRMFPEIPSWDLWCVNWTRQTSANHCEVITDTFADTGRKYIKEYRIYERIYKRDVWYVATRTQ